MGTGFEDVGMELEAPRDGPGVAKEEEHGLEVARWTRRGRSGL